MILPNCNPLLEAIASLLLETIDPRLEVYIDGSFLGVRGVQRMMEFAICDGSIRVYTEMHKPFDGWSLADPQLIEQMAEFINESWRDA